MFYGHVLGFKGPERPVVVLAVNGMRDQSRSREYLYVGLSRARSCLVVCGDLDCIAAAGARRRSGAAVPARQGRCAGARRAFPRQRVEQAVGEGRPGSQVPQDRGGGAAGQPAERVATPGDGVDSHVTGEGFGRFLRRGCVTGNLHARVSWQWSPNDTSG